MVAWMIPAAMLASSAIAAGGGIMANSARGREATAANEAAFKMADADRRDAQTQYYDTQQFQERMANSAYQRGMADMKLAGLNPILAYEQGGATSPAGGGPVRSGAVPFQVPQVDNVLGPAVSAAMQAATTIQGLQQGAAQIQQIEEQTRFTTAETHRSNMQAGLIAAETANTSERERLTRNMVQTELDRQRQLQAEAALASARTASEREVPERTRAETALRLAEGDRANQQANLAGQQTHNLRTYGPNGPVASTVGGISQVINSIRESIRQHFQ